MNRAIIVHGKPDKEEYYNKLLEDSQSNSHWIPWLQQELCQRDILAQTPEMPIPYDPNYELWKEEFEKYKPDENTIIVGHSCGGGFIVRWLSENPNNKVKKAVLVAPWLDLVGIFPAMFKFQINSDISLQSKNGIDVLYSTDDYKDVISSVDYLKQNTNNFNYHEFEGYRHFTHSRMKTRKFPELLQICLGQ
jgi:predicted alpha/beta hydrolase family esterase